MDHLRANGFRVKPVDVNDASVYRARYGIPHAYGGCHTGVVAGYAIEGHVPAREIKRLLAEKPKARGLAVPGMPLGSPGMEQGPVSGYDRYDVLAFTAQGTTSVFATHGPPRR